MRFVFYVAVSHVNEVRADLSAAHYAATLFRLQNLGNIDVQSVLEFANEAWMKDHPCPAKQKPKKK
jgi:hypothetical protein